LAPFLQHSERWLEQYLLSVAFSADSGTQSQESFVLAEPWFSLQNALAALDMLLCFQFHLQVRIPVFQTRDFNASAEQTPNRSKQLEFLGSVLAGPAMLQIGDAH
jgi:hypothetical protein